jgi:hypothetical protein
VTLDPVVSLSPNPGMLSPRTRERAAASQAAAEGKQPPAPSAVPRLPSVPSSTPRAGSLLSARRPIQPSSASTANTTTSSSSIPSLSALAAASQAPSSSAGSSRPQLFPRARTAQSIGGFTRAERDKFWDVFQMVACEPPPDEGTPGATYTGWGDADSAGSGGGLLYAAAPLDAQHKRAEEVKSVDVKPPVSARNARRTSGGALPTATTATSATAAAAAAASAAASAAAAAAAAAHELHSARAAERELRRQAAVRAATAAGAGQLTLKKERMILLLEKMELLLTEVCMRHSREWGWDVM